MKQTINFLKVLPKSSKSWLSPLRMGLILLALLLLLVLISMILGTINLQLDNALEDTQNDLVVAQQDYAKLAKAYPILISDVPLVEQVKNLEGEFLAKKAQLSAMEHLIIRRGFSKYLFDLAQETPNTIWLNQIQIDHDSENITLNGYAIRADSVSELMSRLLRTKAFKNVIFKLFFVKTLKDYPYLKFSIATEDLGPQEETLVEQTVVKKTEVTKAPGGK